MPGGQVKSHSCQSATPPLPSGQEIATRFVCAGRNAASLPNSHHIDYWPKVFLRFIRKNSGLRGLKTMVTGEEPTKPVGYRQTVLSCFWRIATAPLIGVRPNFGCGSGDLEYRFQDEVKDLFRLLRC